MYVCDVCMSVMYVCTLSLSLSVLALSSWSICTLNYLGKQRASLIMAAHVVTSTEHSVLTSFQEQESCLHDLLWLFFCFCLAVTSAIYCMFSLFACMCRRLKRCVALSAVVKPSSQY